MCRILGVSSAGYYNWIKKSKNDDNLDPRDFLIKAEFANHNKKYGSPRISKKLTGKGHPISQSTVGRRMKKMGLIVKKKRKYKKTTESNHRYAVAQNLLNQNFYVNSPNAVWVSDITYILTEMGWMYLVVILDLFSRKIVSWETSPSLKHSFVINALNLAILRRNPSKGLIFHSDRGVQYACHEFTDVLLENGFLQSMSAKGNCYDNAVVESFFGLLKRERVNRTRYLTRDEARDDIFDYIERFYNRKRRHGYLGNISPAAFEKRANVQLQTVH